MAIKTIHYYKATSTNIARFSPRDLNGGGGAVAAVVG